MIAEQFIIDLLDRVDIVDVVTRYIPLENKDGNLSAPCPFHADTTSSFTVSHEKQFYECSICGAQGSAIGFLMRYRHLHFLIAVEELARSVSMPVHYKSENSA